MVGVWILDDGVVGGYGSKTVGQLGSGFFWLLVWWVARIVALVGLSSAVMGALPSLFEVY